MNLRGPSWSEQLWFGRALRCDPLMVDALAGAVSLVCCCVPVSWLALLETVTWFCCCCCCCCCSCLGAVASTCASTVANVVAPSNSVQLCSTPTVVFRMLADPSFSTLLLRYCGSFLLTSVVFACPWRLCCREKGGARPLLFPSQSVSWSLAVAKSKFWMECHFCGVLFSKTLFTDTLRPLGDTHE